MSTTALAGALKAAVESAGVAFGDGTMPPDATTRYVVAWLDAGRIEDRSLRSRDGWSATGVFHCYGLSQKAARYANDKLTTAILGLRGTSLAGRVLLMPEQVSTVPLQRDDDMDPPMFDAISEWRFRTSA